MTAMNGYKQFKKTTLPNIKNKLQSLKKGQSPKTFFITCSDSRVCPNTLTATDFGELFVLRNAGNHLPPPSNLRGSADKATLEYAVQALGVEEIVVCGHTKCGAVGAVMDGVDERQLPYLSDYLKQFATLRETAREKQLEWDDLVEENVRMQLENILAYPFVEERVEMGKLKLYGWVYHIDSGEVEVVLTEKDLKGAA